MPNKRDILNNAADRFDDTENRAYTGLDDDLFAALEEETVSEDRLPIMSITPDPTQPRRIIPREMRGQWNGTPAGVPALIAAWGKATGITREKIVRCLMGRDSIHELDGDPALIRIIDLAAQIRDVGLQQPIGVIRRGDAYRIIFGERRWMAFHLLADHLGDDYTMIPARVADVDDWRLAKIQAAENFQRVELNAIEKARQLAKLLMSAISASSRDIEYDPFDHLVIPGGCDRPYYAQVSNGNIHRIPRGMGPEFEASLGISTGQMRNYRALLALTGDHDVDNALWDLGDMLDWAEQFMREISTNLTVDQIRDHLALGGDVEERLRTALKLAKERPTESPYRHYSDGSDEDNQSYYSKTKPDEPASNIPYPVGSTAYLWHKLVEVVEVRNHGIRRVLMDDGAKPIVNVSQLSDHPREREQPHQNPFSEPRKITPRPADDFDNDHSSNRHDEALQRQMNDNTDELRPRIADDERDIYALDEYPGNIKSVLEMIFLMAQQLNHNPAASAMEALASITLGDLDDMRDWDTADRDEWLRRKLGAVDHLHRQLYSMVGDYIVYLASRSDD